MTKSFWPYYGTGVDSASHRKEYQEYLLKVKVRRSDNLVTFMGRLSRNPGSLNLLEPKGLGHACKGIALLTFT